MLIQILLGDECRRFCEHNEEVKATVPPERLLVFDVKQGWEPLCAFLGVPVPDGPFPHVNDTESFKQMYSEWERVGNTILATTAAVGVAAIAIGAYLCRS